MLKENGLPTRPLIRYLVSVVAIVTAFIVRMAIARALGIQLSTYFTFYLGVVLVALFAGVRAGLLSVALSALMATWILPPHGRLLSENVTNVVGLVLFVCIGTIICLAIEQYRRWKSDAQLHSILESLSEGLLVADLSGHILHWNHAALELHGFSSSTDGDQSLNELATIFELSAPDGKMLSVEEWPISRALRGERLHEMECRVRRVDRNEWKRVFSYGGRCISDADGRPTLAVLTIRDITDSKRVETELAWKTAFLEAEVNSTVDGVLVVDAEGKRILQNQALTGMWNLPQSILDVSDDQSQIEYVAEQTKYPEKFKDKVKFLYDHPSESSHDEVELKDGRVIDRYSGPVLGKNQEHYGRVWTFRDITDRKRADEALRQSEERSRVLFQSISDALMVHSIMPDGQTGRFIEVNDVACKRLGYTREEMLRMSPKDIDEPGSESIHDSISEQLLKGNNVIMEQSHMTKTGELIPVEIHSRMFTLRGVPAVIALVRDIRQRKQTERALRESEQRLTQAVHVAGLGIFEQDHITGEIHCSPVLKEILGWHEVGDPTHSLLLEKVWPADREILISTMSQLSDPLSKGLVAIEHRIVRPDGVRWVGSHAEVFFEGEGVSRHPVRTVGAVQDITDRKVAELRLKESQQQLRTAMDAAKLGVWSRDLKTGVITADEMTRSIFGWAADVIVTESSLLNLIVPEDRVLFEERSAQLTEDVIGVEYRIDLLGKGIRWVSVRGSLLRDSLGNPTHLTGVVQNITAKKQAERELQALEQQFRHAQKMEAVGRLAGGIAHDFNNLLMVILSYTEIMEDSLPAHDGLRTSTRAIMKAANQAASLTGQMLAFSRNQIVSPVVLDLSSCINDSAKMLQRVIGEDIELRVISERLSWAVLAGQDQISQVLMNLSVNARDAMPQGGVLTIETRNVTVDESLMKKHPFLLPGEYAVFSVTDTGTGMTKEIQEHILEPFFTTKCVGKGTGLGLSTVYGIVKQSGGYLLVDSEPGHGACFTIYLPRVKSVVEAPAMPDSEQPQSGRETLLIVEDEDSLRESLCEYLGGRGYTILRANSGTQALKISSDFDHPIDLMITDVVMPKMSGRELSQMLGSLRPELKTIFMSGYTDDAIVRHGVQEAKVAFLQKPFSLATLAHKVRDILSTAEGTRPRS
jgi:PAS domain S-box-containing protein